MRNLCFISLLVFLLLPITMVKAQMQEAYETKSGIKYLIYFPKDYKVNGSAPLLLFLHGLGEKGENIEKVKKYGPPQMIKKSTWPDELPFVVASPQLPAKYNSWPSHLIDNILEEIKFKYSIDNQRVYLTGLSLGGIGAWQYATNHPEKLAAVIPICGIGNPANACKLQNLPVWAFHGDQDGLVKPSGSINMIEALKKCKDRDDELTKLTLYPGVKHDSWTATYNNPEIYRWLLKFRNEKISPELTINQEAYTNKTRDRINLELPEKKSELRELCNLPASISESSGLQSYQSGFIWTHNDSGHQPVIYQIDTAGKINQLITITNATNYDWEDLAKDAEGNLYIGDFGNNQNNRKSLQIYKIPNPEELKTNRIKAEVIEYFYPDQNSFPPSPASRNFDMEAMLVFDQHIYLFSKNSTQPFSGFTKLYKLPTTPGNYEAELLDSLQLGTSNMLENVVTGADISPDQNRIALLTYSKVIILSNFKGNQFFKGDIHEIPLNALTQKEGITFKNNTELLISDEKFKGILGGKLYLFDVSGHAQQ